MRMAAQAGVLPEQFWRMTAREFLWWVEGANLRDKENMRRLAWQACIIISPWCGRNTPTPQELLGESVDLHPEFDDPEQFKTYMRKRAEESEP